MLQEEYYKLLVWFFCSPFMPKIRRVAFLANKNVNIYPTNALIYGIVMQANHRLSLCSISHDYFNNDIAATPLKQAVRDIWRDHPDYVDIDKRRNRMWITFSKNEYESNRIKRVMSGCPWKLHATRADATVAMDLDAAKEFFGIDFKKRNRVLEWMTSRR